MKILLSNHSLQYIGGTEKWVHGMARELTRRGHRCDVFTFLTGLSSEKIAEYGEILSDLDGRRYDLKIVNHNTCQALARSVPGPMIFTAHGPRHPLEVPTIGADAYVGVSREVRARAATYGISVRVVTNGIDLEEFSPGEPGAGPVRVLSMCKIGLASQMVRQACDVVGYEFQEVHYIAAPVWDVASLMREADIVVGCGRTAIEGLASGCQVLVFDARIAHSPRADGWLTPDNIEHLRQCNFSTRAYGMEWSVEDVVRALLRYPGRADWPRQWAEANADVREKAGAYLSLGEELQAA